MDEALLSSPCSGRCRRRCAARTRTGGEICFGQTTAVERTAGEGACSWRQCVETRSAGQCKRVTRDLLRGGMKDFTRPTRMSWMNCPNSNEKIEIGVKRKSNICRSVSTFLALCSNISLQKSLFIPPWRREEEREEKQRQMETAFEQVYQDKHRKRRSSRRNDRVISLSLFLV